MDDYSQKISEKTKDKLFDVKEAKRIEKVPFKERSIKQLIEDAVLAYYK